MDLAHVLLSACCGLTILTGCGGSGDVEVTPTATALSPPTATAPAPVTADTPPPSSILPPAVVVANPEAGWPARSNEDANALASVGTRTALASSADYERTVADLAAVFNETPLATGRQKQIWNSRLVVYATDEAEAQQLFAGNRSDFNALNARYGATGLDVSGPRIRLYFSRSYNTSVVRAEYQKVAGVRSVSVDGISCPAMIGTACSIPSGPTTACMFAADTAFSYLVTSNAASAPGYRSFRLYQSKVGATPVLLWAAPAIDTTAQSFDWLREAQAQCAAVEEGSPAPAANPGTMDTYPVELHTVDRNNISGYWLPTHPERERFAVVKDPATWAALWVDHMSNIIPAPPLPEIDFSTQMVIGVFFAGNYGCFGTEIRSIVDIQDKRIVQYHDSLPPAGAICTASFVQPSHLVSVPRSELPVVFEAVQ